MPGSTPQPGRRWLVRGQVQGVGFRPFVYRIAREHGLTGWVRNDTAGVTIEGWGCSDAIDAFHHALLRELPPLARIDHVGAEPLEGTPDADGFRIIESASTAADRGRVAVDSATCADCRRELLDATDRRHRHPLINCTNCGPRFTIVQDVPYDRALTTMSGFAMCAACATEYADPADRRFHAQPNCCNACGPRVALRDADGKPIIGDPFRAGAELLRAGKVVAVKGLGGYHLAADATNADAVAGLRARKRRDHKPFAVMVRDLESARELVDLSPAAEAELVSPAAPIILAPARPDAPITDAVAPGSHRLGVMIAHTPIQHLLFAEGLGPLIMTSANLTDEPLAKDDAEAAERLAGIHDAILSHDRPIEQAVDDSILIDTTEGLIPIRRARGYVPTPIALPFAAPSPGLCVGGELKNTVAIITGRDAVLSQHVGDLTQTLAYTRFVRTIDDMCRLFGVEPEWIACDAHPGYLSRRHARALANDRGLPLIEVQHHHAHLASVLAEHGRADRAIGLICDGVGYGDDGTAWGGELLVGDLRTYERLGRLRPLRLPGGDAAAKNTTRCALSWLADLLGPDAESHPAWTRTMPDDDERNAVSLQLRRDLNCPPSSGMGRLFDAAAALLGVCAVNRYEAMSGQLLESAATQSTAKPSCDGASPVRTAGGLLELDHRGLLTRLLAGLDRNEPVADLAWLFHDALAAGLSELACAAHERTGLSTVALSGGVFCNELLTGLTTARLQNIGLIVLKHSSVSCNDGGLALGQSAVAGAMLAHEV